MGVLALLLHPDEILPTARMYLKAKKATKLPRDPDLAFCYDILNSVSRSFAVVIQQLPNPLRDAICVFYLVLRGLDTVEDDMAIPVEEKLPALHSFHEKISQINFKMDCGYKHYKRLMNEFDTVVRVFLSLDRHFQDVIRDITKRMGDGMAEFIQKEVITVADYDKYCHYVAGLVGIGLSQLFASSELEAPAFGSPAFETVSNHMGLFLQKTNIIRDYLEDIQEEPAPRMFWPRDIWSRYGATLDVFQEPGKRAQAVRCLNHMVVDALRHVPHCIEYLARLEHMDVFRFCAIPQVMAAGTLAACYNNGRVFEGVVKMRRGETATVFDTCSDLGATLRWFLRYLGQIEDKMRNEVASDDPSLDDGLRALAKNREVCQQRLRMWESHHAGPGSPAQWIGSTAGLLAAGTYFYYAVPLGAPSATGLPEALQPHSWLLSDFRPLHTLIALLLVLFMLRAIIFGPN